MCKNLQSAILQRTLKCHEQLGVSYKKMYQGAEINRSTFYNFTSGARGLQPEQEERLDQYLQNLGY